MRCPACGVESSAGARFCSGCGEKLPTGCTRCGSAVTPGARFCSDCGASLAAAPAPSAATQPPPTDVPDLEGQFAAMQRAMPSSVRERLIAADDGENRVLTILFADLTGSTRNTVDMRPEDAAARINDVLKAMVDAVLEFDGRINRLLGDAVLAFFGTPQAHENDPERAILAALRIRERVQALGFDVTAGINTGEVYLGALGNAAHHEVTAMGNAIVLAARMREKAAPGEILVGAETYQYTRRGFGFVERSIEAKGFPAPVPAYLVEGRLARPEKVRGIEGLRADLIGRDDELGRLDEALAEIRRGRGQMVTIVGEGGVGKSRLIGDLSLRARADPATAPRWLEGRSLDVSMGVSYWPFLDLLRAFVGWTVDDTEPRRAERLVGALQRLVDEGALERQRFQELVPLLADLLSVELGTEWPKPVHAGPEHARQQTFVALRDLVLALARGRGLVLVLDDLHWADPLSLDVVSLLMEAITLAPLLLVCVYRPDREHKVAHLATMAARKCAGRYTEIQLRELTPAQSRRLVTSLLRIEDLPAPLADLILDKGQGNPFFVEEVVRALIDAGVVYRDGDAWRARPEIGGVAVPASIQSVILSRVDRLQDEARRVLQSASVIGRVFRRRVLARVTEREADLDRNLWELEERSLIYEGRVTPEPEYAFQHQLTQETVYQNLVRRQREAFHGEVAQAIEALYADGLDEFYEQLAYHYERSGLSDKALEYLRRAGEKAVERSSNADAVRYFDRALALAGEGEARRDLLGLRARCHIELFDGPAAAAAFEELLDLAERRGEQPRQLEALLGLGRALYLLGLDDQTGSYALKWRTTHERAYEIAKQLGDKRGMARALLPTAWFVDTWPEYREQADANTREALALAEEIDDDRLRLDARMARRRFLPAREALSEGESLVAELAERRHLGELNNLYFSLMWTNLRCGKLERGVEVCDLGIELAGRLGVPPVQYPTIKAMLLTRMGRFGEAQRALDQEIADDAHPFGRAFRGFGEGVLRFELGGYDAAAELFERMIEDGRQLNRGWMQMTGRNWLTLARIRAGRIDEAWAAQVEAELGGGKSPSWLPGTDVELLLWRGDVEGALRAADAALTEAREQGRATDEVIVARSRAGALRQLGRQEEALAALDSALGLAESIGFRPAAWRLHSERAGLLEAMGRAAEAAEARRVGLSTLEAVAATVEDEGLGGGLLADSDAIALREVNA